MTNCPVTPSVPGFRPLATLLANIAATTRQAARLRLVTPGRDVLVAKLRDAFMSGQRERAFLLAEELIARGVPPAFWHALCEHSDYTTNQKFDLLLYDLGYLRRWHADHAKSVRYVRCKTLLTGGEAAFHREAEFIFYQGKRPAWKAVSSLSLTPSLQWSCHWLRSAPVRKMHADTCARAGAVLLALESDLNTVRRTSTFTADDAATALQRRYALWLCARMTGGSSSETAYRYQQMTGLNISRQAAAKQLEKVREVLRKNKATA